jgi:hypothetical protein
LGLLCFKSFIVLPLAALSAAALAQTVTYGVPIPCCSVTPNTVTLNGTQVITTTGCLPPNTASNGSTTESVVDPGFIVQTPFDGASGPEQRLQGMNIVAPIFVLPTALQPSSVVVVTNGVSQSNGQTYAPAPITGPIPGGTGTYMESYTATVSGTKFIEKAFFSAGGFTEEDDSSYDVPTGNQVASIITKQVNQSPSGTPFPGCVQTATTNESGTNTFSFAFGPAIVVAAMLPPATVGTPYSARLISGGNQGTSAGYGLGPATGVPPGLTINTDGTVTGVPTAPATGSQTFIITLTQIGQFPHQIDGPVNTTLTVHAPSGTSCSPPVPPAPSPGKAWYQLDPAWADLPYDSAQQIHSEVGAHTSIGDRGGMLTGLAYMLASAGVTYLPGTLYTPATLDVRLGEFNNDFSWAVTSSDDGGSISLGTAVKDAAANRVIFSRAKTGSRSTADLDAYLCHYDVPVLLQVNDPATNYRHYVVATAKGSTGYSIVDPGFKNRTNLSAYSGKFMILGVLQPPTSNDEEFDTSIVDNATLLITAPDKTSTGLDVPSGAAQQSPPAAAYFAIDNAVNTDTETVQPSSTTYSVQMHAPAPGLYTIKATGLHTGVFYVTAKYQSPVGGSTVVSTPGIATLNSISEFYILVSESLPQLRLWRVPSFATAVADVANGLKVGIVSAQMAQTLTNYLNTAQRSSYIKDAVHEQQEMQALTAFKQQVQTLRSTAAINVLGGDADSLIAVIP